VKAKSREWRKSHKPESVGAVFDSREAHHPVRDEVHRSKAAGRWPFDFSDLLDYEQDRFEQVTDTGSISDVDEIEERVW
jgi:hypothetical protein